MEQVSISEKIAAIATDAAKKNGVKFVHSELVGTKRNMTVRVYIDKPEGVNIDDCSNVSRTMEEVLDADDFIPSAYVLEVSSPGLERGLYTLDDYRMFEGRKAKIKTSAPIGPQSNFSGRIKGVEDSTIIFDDKTSGTVRIPFETVAKANLKVDLDEEFKKKR